MVQHRRMLAATKRFSRELLRAQDQEQERVARELHDGLMQHVAVIGAELEGLRESVRNPPEFTHRLTGVREELEDLGESMRLLARAMHPTAVDRAGLLPALQLLANEFRTSAGLEIEFDVQGVVPALERDTALTLYRVAQEALRNVVRHSGTTRAQVMLVASADTMTLMIADQGRGIPPDQANGGAGLGLRSMRERLAIVHGTLAVRGMADRGTGIEARVPLGSLPTRSRA